MTLTEFIDSARSATICQAEVLEVYTPESIQVGVKPREYQLTLIVSPVVKTISLALNIKLGPALSSSEVVESELENS